MRGYLVLTIGLSGVGILPLASTELVSGSCVWLLSDEFRPLLLLMIESLKTFKW